ncbi:hypothetical protein IWX91DRAFT_152678 [Phyllosticta citricarpa]
MGKSEQRSQWPPAKQRLWASLCKLAAIECVRKNTKTWAKMKENAAILSGTKAAWWHFLQTSIEVTHKKEKRKKKVSLITSEPPRIFLSLLLCPILTGAATLPKLWSQGFPISFSSWTVVDCEPRFGMALKLSRHVRAASSCWLGGNQVSNWMTSVVGKKTWRSWRLRAPNTRD